MRPGTYVSRIVLALMCLLQLGCASLHRVRVYERGTQALEAGEYQRALDDLTEALRYAATPTQASKLRNHIGLAYLGLGQRDLALAAFREAIALDCRNEAARENLNVVEGVNGSP